MSQLAIDAFKSGNRISLNAGAGRSIVTYSAGAQASWGNGDIILRSNTKSAYAGATVSGSDLNWAVGNSRAFYGRKVDPAKVLAGEVDTPNAKKLKNVLTQRPDRVEDRTGGLRPRSPTRGDDGECGQPVPAGHRPSFLRRRNRSATYFRPPSRVTEASPSAGAAAYMRPISRG